MKRGDLLICIPPGDFGKPRPAVIVQADLFNDARDTLTVCLITGELIDASLFRVRLEPGPDNRLTKPSDVMIDKLMTLKKDRLGTPLGHLTAAQLHAVNDALRRWLDLALCPPTLP